MLQECAICGSRVEYLTNQKDIIEIKTDTKLKRLEIIGLSFGKCTNVNCGEAFLGPHDSDLWEQKVNEALENDRKKQGLLTGREIKNIRKNLGLSQVEFSQLLGLGLKTFAKYERYRADQSQAMDLLLRAIRIYGLELIKKIKQEREHEAA